MPWLRFVTDTALLPVGKLLLLGFYSRLNFWIGWLSSPQCLLASDRKNIQYPSGKNLLE